MNHLVLVETHNRLRALNTLVRNKTFIPGNHDMGFLIEQFY